MIQCWTRTSHVIDAGIYKAVCCALRLDASAYSGLTLRDRDIGKFSIATHCRCYTVTKVTNLAENHATPKALINSTVEAHLKRLAKEYQRVGEELSKSAISAEPSKIAKLGKEYSELGVYVQLSDQRDDLRRSISELLELEDSERSTDTSEGDEMADLAAEDRRKLQEQLKHVEDQIIRQLTPKDDADHRGVVLEVRSGTGGDEASLFASEVFKMYQKFSSLQGWRWEQVSLSASEVGGFKDAQASISGEDVYKHLKFESGVHRVQRVPSNDVRIHTSACSVIVIPEAEEIDVELRPQDLKIDVFRSQGAGGQSVNTTESAVRITHLPTGCVVSMQDERSQIQNRARAMKILRTRVYDVERQRALEERMELRTAARGTGDRADKIRTYNFPQDRITDHRIGYTTSGVERMLEGDGLIGIIDALNDSDEKERLERFMQGLASSKSTS